MSLRLTKDIVIALELMEVIKGKKYPSKVVELAPTLSTTPSFLKHIVNRLKKAGLINIKRGPGGGITRNGDEPVSVVEIFKAMGKPILLKGESKEAKILAKVEAALQAETC
jgi:DNA-binding IscR family transcriptional regulator